MPEAARLYRENIALKAQLDVLEARLKREEEKPKKKRPLRERAAQVFAYLLTRENEPFQRYFLTEGVLDQPRDQRQWPQGFRHYPLRPRYEFAHGNSHFGLQDIERHPRDLANFW